MTWQTLDGQKPFVAEHFRRLRDELAARNAEAVANPPPMKFDHTKPPVIGRSLRIYLDKLKVETAEAERLEADGD